MRIIYTLLFFAMFAFIGNQGNLNATSSPLENEEIATTVLDEVSIADLKDSGELGTIYTIRGVALNGAEFRGIRYVTDGTGFVAIYRGDLSDGIVERGDSIVVTGELVEFNGLLEISNIEPDGIEIISSGNDLPEPQVITTADFNEDFEAAYVMIENVVIDGSEGTFGSGTNYNIIDEDGNTAVIRIDSGTEFAGTSIPEEAITIVGLMGQFNDTYQIFPRDFDDLGIDEEPVDPPEGEVFIGDLRDTGELGTIYTIRGVALNGAEFRGIRYVTDGTGFVAIYRGDLSDGIVERGDSIVVTGELVEFNGLLEISNIEPDGIEIISSGNTLPEPQIITTDDFNEDQEAAYVMIENVVIGENGGTFEAGTNYDITDEDGNTAVIRIDSGTEFAGTPIPEEAITIVGLMGQFNDIYQIFPRDLSDIGSDEEPVDPPEGEVSIVDLKDSGELGEIYTVRGVALNGAEFRGVRYITDGTGFVAIYREDLSDGIVERGDSIVVTGELVEFNGLFEISNIEDNGIEIISSGNALPEPQVITTDDFNEELEAAYVMIENVVIDGSGGVFGSGTNYDITDENGNPAVIRIDLGTDFEGSPIPGESIAIVGLMGQFNDIYQIFPRDFDDFIFSGGPGLASAITLDELTQNSLTFAFETSTESNASINYGLTEDLELGNIAGDDFTNSHNITVDGLEPGQIYYVQVVTESETGEQSVSAVIPYATVSESTGNIDVYFNRSVDTSVATGEEAISLINEFADTLIAYMQKAKHTLDIAIYNMDNDNGLVDAINEVAANGIEVRLVSDASAMSNSIFNSIDIGSNNKKWRPDVATDYGLMHNKFIIIDADSEDANDCYVITGSTNFTDNQLKFDANNLIIVQDQSIARTYELEFEELFAETFAEDKTNNTPKDFLVGGKKMEIYFSPTDNTDFAIKNTLSTADVDLYFALLAFTRTSIAYTILDEIEDGVFVAGILDGVNDTDEDDDPYEVLDIMEGRLINDATANQMHHKYAIIDPSAPDSDPTVITGSANWSNNGVFNSDENIMIVHDAKIANLYYQEFVQRYKDTGGTELIDTTITDTFINELLNTTAQPLICFPNPSSDKILFNLDNLDIQERQVQQETIEIINQNGQIVDTKEFVPVGQNTVYAVTIEALPKGMYYLRVGQKVGRFIKE